MIYCNNIYFQLYSLVSLVVTCAVFWPDVVGGDVIVERRLSEAIIEIRRFEDTLAWFGPDLPDNGLVGVVKVASPVKGCGPMEGPPQDVKLLNNLQWFVLVERGHCNFLTKVENAFEANYSAVIIYDNTGDIIEKSKLSESDQLDLRASNIPSVFIGQADGRQIIDHYTYKHKTWQLRLTDETPYISIYLIPFAIVIAICFFIMVGIMLFKCIQDRRRERRHRLPKSSLKKIPTKKFAAGDEAHYEVCCICLDDYVLGEKLRILPCDHAYHMKCIDPWLLKNKRVCPQCRKKVFATGDVVPSDSEDESEDERAPLLSRGGAAPLLSRGGARGGSTFAPQAENPFVLANRRASPSQEEDDLEDEEDDDDDEEPMIMGNQLLTEVHVEQGRGSVNGEDSVIVDHSGDEGSHLSSSTSSSANIIV